jgi:hypothetical protein
MSSTSEDHLSSILTNPFYAVTFVDEVFKHRKLASAHEDWVLLNAKLMNDMGIKKWLEELLDALSVSSKEYDSHDIINPSLAVMISDRLQGDHQPLVTHEQWIQANTKQIEEIGANKWLWQLLDTLETGGPKEI